MDVARNLIFTVISGLAPPIHLSSQQPCSQLTVSRIEPGSDE
jgi:hypothetical protein